jgi:hypothetical protein
MQVHSLAGDLTGLPRESALIVRSGRPLPTDGTLVGHHVYVWHQCGPHLQSVYTIARLSPLEGDHWRIDLAGNPPFVLQRARVLSIDGKDPRKMEQTFQFHVVFGKLNSRGRRIRFLRSGFETSLQETGRSAFSVAESPPPGAVKKGDAFVVFNVQAGDRAVIPSRFVCRREESNDDGEACFALKTTGAAELVIPGRYRAATVEAGEQREEVEVREIRGESTGLTVAPPQLEDGCGRLILRP